MNPLSRQHATREYELFRDGEKSTMQEEADFLNTPPAPPALLALPAPRGPTFYVDPVTEYPPESIRGAARRVGRRWSHLWTDGTPEDLHAFAARIGMKRSWFQNHRRLPHYDLVPARRAAAIKLGAVEMHLREWFDHNR